jgi:hypothetical protein
MSAVARELLKKLCLPLRERFINNVVSCCASAFIIMSAVARALLFLKMCPFLDVILGCQWSEWTAWSECTKTCGGGNVQRVREKLPGLGSCTGASEEITLCDNEVCPLENDDNSLVMVIGGETVASRENEHSSSVEIVGPNGLCR